MKVKDFVEESVRKYNIIFKTHEDVMEHIFMVLGNGICWYKGEPVRDGRRSRSKKPIIVGSGYLTFNSIYPQSDYNGYPMKRLPTNITQEWKEACVQYLYFVIENWNKFENEFNKMGYNSEEQLQIIKGYREDCKIKWGI